MTIASSTSSRSPVAGLISSSRGALIGVAFVSAAVNVLALTGSFYMLQVYDRVLNSRSLPTLVGLTAIMLVLYAAYGYLDMLRSQILGRLGLRLDRRLRDHVFAAIMLTPLRAPGTIDALQPMRDLDQIRTVLTGPGPTAAFDAPWLPIYLGMIYVLHPWLGLLATSGALILILLTWMTERRSRIPARAAVDSASERFALAEAARRNAEAARANGLGPALAGRWSKASEKYLLDSIGAAEATSGFITASRVFRIVLQSCMLGLGALIVIKGEATGGIIIAASIMGSRALAPIELAIANWRNFVNARQSYDRLSRLLKSLPNEDDRLDLPAPKHRLEVEALSVSPPGELRPILHNVAFAVAAGDGLGVIGPSASGKSTLVRAIVGAWAANRGTVRLDGSALDQWRPAALGLHIGYMPQESEIFDGTIAENIARLDKSPNADAVIKAARAAGVHEMIIAMPGGYNARVGRGGSALSAGQRQRIAFARALFGDPFLVVLDEPNSNLDAEGDAALASAITSIRRRGGIAIVVAHRPSGIAAMNKLLVLSGGQVQVFGSKEEILAGAQKPTPAATNGSASPAVLKSVHETRIGAL